MHFLNIKKRFIIIFTFLFMMLTSLFGNIYKVSALSTEIVQTRVDVVSTTRTGNTVKVVTLEEYDFENCTYAIIYYDNYNGEKIKVSDLLHEQDITQLSKKSFSFDVSDKVLGVIIYKIGYWRSSNEWTEKFVEGDVKVGDTDSVLKKTWVSVTADLLTSGNICNNSESLAEVLSAQNNCDSYYMFYFNLDIDVDEIIDVDFKYKIKTVKKDWIWSGSYEEITDWIRISANKDELVPNYTFIEEFLEGEVLASCAHNHSCYISNKDTFNKKYEEMKKEYVWPVLGDAQMSGYTWRIQPLKELTLVNDESWGGTVYTKQYLQEMAIVEMSFYADGEYYEDIAVLDENTGEVIVDHDPSWFDAIKEFFDKVIDFVVSYWWKILLCIVLIIVLVRFGITLLIKLLWFVIKYTLGLPFIWISNMSNRKREDRRIKKTINKYNKKNSLKNSKNNKKNNKKKNK